MTAAGDNTHKTKKTKKNKKAKKDKWGQPLPTAATEDEEVPFDAPDSGMIPEEEEDDGRVPSGGKGEASQFEPNKVVVSGMPYSAAEDDIHELFKDVGTISQLQLSRFPDSGNFRGLAFVTFQTEKTATKALELDGMKMGNRFVKVERCRLDPQRKRKREFPEEPKKVEGCYSAYIGNLSLEVTEDDIRELFSTSKIDSIRFAVNKKTGKFRGFGHVDFADDESLEQAISKNQVELHGRPMKIAYAVSNRD